MAGKPQKYLFLAKEICDFAEALNLKHGDILPSERFLSNKFSCNHLTIRKALQLLEDENKIYKVPSKGSYWGRRKLENLSSRKIIGFLFPNDDLYYYRLFVELEEHLYKLGLHPILHITGNNAKKEADILDYLQKNEAAAIVAVPNRECIENYQKIKIPTLFFDNGIDELNISQVLSDNYSGAVKAIEYLYNMGHRKIAYIGGENDFSGKIRRQGYFDVLKKYNIPVTPNYLKSQPQSREWGFYGARDFFSMSEVPSAIFCENDTIAAGVIGYCHDNNIKIPQDCSIIGFGNTAIANDLNLSSVSQHSDKIAISLIKNIELLLRDEKPEDYVLIPTKLIIRGTTAQYLG